MLDDKYKYKLIAPIEIMIAVLILWCLYFCTYYDGRPCRSNYGMAEVQIAHMFQVIKRFPEEYVGLPLKDIHNRLFSHYSKEFLLYETKEMRWHLKIGDEGFVMDPWGKPYAIEIEKCAVDRGGGTHYRFRISSAGANGAFDFAEKGEKGDDIVREEIFCL